MTNFTLKRELIHTYTIAYFSIAILTCAISLSMSLPAAIRFYDHAAPAMATVVSTDCNNHAHVEYKVIIQGRALAMTRSSGICEYLVKNQNIVIWYNVNDIYDNGPKTPKSRIVGVVTTSILSSLIFPAVLLFGLYVRSGGARLVSSH